MIHEIHSVSLVEENDSFINFMSISKATNQDSTKEKITRMIFNLPKPFMWFLCVYFVIGIICILYNKTILSTLNNISKHIYSIGWIGYLLVILLTIITSFPFTIGYSFALFLSGLSYGFPYGFIPAYLGTMIGSSSAFIICKYYFKDHVVSYLRKTTFITVTEELLESSPMQTLLLLRLAPVPFSIINCLCSGLNVKLGHFVFATGLIQTRILLHIYLGSTVANLAIADSHATLHAIELCVSIVLLLGFMGLSTYLYWKYQKKISKVQYDQLKDIPLYDDSRTFQFN